MNKAEILQAAREWGGVVKFSAALGLSRGAVSQWQRVPAEHVLTVERLTGISRYVLRPDIYGPLPKDTPARVTPSHDGGHAEAA